MIDRCTTMRIVYHGTNHMNFAKNEKSAIQSFGHDTNW